MMKFLPVLVVCFLVTCLGANAEEGQHKNKPVLAEIQQLLSTVQFLKKEVTELRTKLSGRGISSTEEAEVIPVSKEHYEKLVKENKELKAKYLENEKFLKTLEKEM